MNKHLRTMGIAAAALAASAALIATPALAQQGRDSDLAGAPRTQQEYPPLFSGQNNDRDWDRDRNEQNRDADRRRAPDFQNAQRSCSRAGIQEAWNRNFYSAQYDGAPRLEYGRRGWELRGRMRLHNSRGYSNVNTVCDVSRNGNADHFEFLR